MTRRITSLAELGNAWQAERVDDWRVRYGTAPLGDPAKSPAPCPCGKISYPSRQAAQSVSPILTAYMCPLGHRVYHLHARGRSTRERGLRR